MNDYVDEPYVPQQKESDYIDEPINQASQPALGVAHQPTQMTQPQTTASVGTMPFADRLFGKGTAQQMLNDIYKNVGERNQKMANWDVPTGLESALSFAPLTMAAKGAPTLGSYAKSLIFKGKKVAPEAASKIALSEATGVPLTPAEITQQKFPSILESTFEKNMASSNIVQDFRERQMEALNKLKGQVQSVLGGATDKLSAGQIAQEAGKARYRQFMAKADKLYNSIPVNPTTPVETNILRDTAMGHLDELGKIDTPAVKRILNIAKKGMTAAETEASVIVDASGRPVMNEIPSQATYSWEQLLSDKSALSKMSNSTGDANKKRILNSLIHAINDDISAFSKTVDNPAIKSALDEANLYYRKGDASLPGVQTFRERGIKNALKSESPEKLVDQFIKPNNISAINRLKQVTGKDGFQPIKQAWMEKLLTLGEEQSFSPQKFARNFGKYTEADLKAILSPAEYKGLKQLSEISRIAQSAERIAGNPSGTAQNLGNMWMMWNTLRHPITMAATMMGSNKFAKMYFGNTAFRDSLIHGTKPGTSDKVSKEIAKRLLLMAGVDVDRKQFDSVVNSTPQRFKVRELP